MARVMARVMIALAALVTANAKFAGSPLYASDRGFMSTGGYTGRNFMSTGRGVIERVTSPFSKNDATRAGVKANKKAINYNADKAWLEEHYAARMIGKDMRFAARRAQRAAFFEANQWAKKGQQQVRKRIRDCKW